MALPKLTPEQRAQALEKATAARRHRSEIKAKLKAKEVTLSSVLKEAEQDEALAKMKVSSLLESLPRVGATTAATIMEEIGIAASRRLRGLGPVQREELVKRFG